MPQDAQELRSIIQRFRPNLRGRYTVKERNGVLELDIDLYGLFGFRPDHLESLLRTFDLFFGETREEIRNGHKHFIVRIV